MEDGVNGKESSHIVLTSSHKAKQATAILFSNQTTNSLLKQLFQYLLPQHMSI